MRPLWIVLINYCLIFLAVSASAEGKSVPGGKFKDWSSEFQQTYIRASLATYAFLVDAKEQDCLVKWSDEHEKTDYKAVVDAIERVTEPEPALVIVSVLENACGKY